MQNHANQHQVASAVGNHFMYLFSFYLTSIKISMKHLGGRGCVLWMNKGKENYIKLRGLISDFGGENPLKNFFICFYFLLMTFSCLQAEITELIK